jgi:hypothetical protein
MEPECYWIEQLSLKSRGGLPVSLYAPLHQTAAPGSFQSTFQGHSSCSAAAAESCWSSRRIVLGFPAFSVSHIEHSCSLCFGVEISITALAMDLSDRLLEPYRSAIVPRILVGMGCRVMTASSLSAGYLSNYVCGDLMP